MFLHLGRDIVISQRSIVAVLDMDTATSSRHSRAFLSQAEKRGQVFVVSDELPRSVVLCVGPNGQNAVYISQISSKTLIKRAREGPDAW